MQAIAPLSAFSLPEVMAAAAKVNLAIEHRIGLFHIYRADDGRWQSAIAGHAGLLDYVNLHISLYNDQVADHAGRETHRAEMTKGFTQAAVLDAQCEVIALALTDPTKQYLTLVDEVLKEGGCLNQRQRKLSRTINNMAKAAMTGTTLLLHVLRMEVVYQLPDTESDYDE